MWGFWSSFISDVLGSEQNKTNVKNVFEFLTYKKDYNEKMLKRRPPKCGASGRLFLLPFLIRCHFDKEKSTKLLKMVFLRLEQNGQVHCEF